MSSVLLAVVSIACTSWNTKPSKLPVSLLYAKFPFVQIVPVAPIVAIVKSSSSSHPKPVTGLKVIAPVEANTVAPVFILKVMSSPF